MTLYEALQDFDDSTAQSTLTIPRLAVAGGDDNITYGPGWGDTIVRIAEPLARHRDQLVGQGWDVQMLPELDHMGAQLQRPAHPAALAGHERVTHQRVAA